VALTGALADREVDEHELPGDADLVRGETDPGGGVHRVDHVVDELLDRLVDLGDRLGGLTEHVVAVFADGQDHFFFRLSIIASTVWAARFL
jgi:hypothetical protein